MPIITRTRARSELVVVEAETKRFELGQMKANAVLDMATKDQQLNDLRLHEISVSSLVFNGRPLLRDKSDEA
jgi:hypothetical protein